MEQKKLLRQVNSPDDLKALSYASLELYAKEARDFIIETVKRQGGHLASNLGAVELSIALHYALNSPSDKIVWDVGHQTYTHKLITGRRETLLNLRSNAGASGFPNIGESVHDCFTIGHSSASLSLGLGLARARDLKKEKFNVVSVIGDGAFSGGMAFEALNDIGDSKAKMIIVLNDNEMSISKNVGAMANYFARLRLSRGYAALKLNIKKAVSSLPFFGDGVIRVLDRAKNSFKWAVQTKKMFELMGIKYLGPFDGHNTANLINIFKSVKSENGPVLIHVLTKKGHGDPDALKDPEKFHGVAPNGSEQSKNFSFICGNKLCDLAEKDEKICAVTAAMSDGTGLSCFSEKFPERYFDVGIAEQHAVSLCAGLAGAGLKPYFAVYSSFLQRAYDQIIHDVCINGLPVTFLVDRAGIIGSDGVTHQGLFDLSYFLSCPGMTVCAPKDGKELENILEWSRTFNKPLAIRYPKNFSAAFPSSAPVQYGKWEVLKKSNSKVYLLCAGNRMLDTAYKVDGVNIVNARFIKPLDKDFLKEINAKGNLILTMEDNVCSGGFGESVLSYLNKLTLKARVVILAWPDALIDNRDILSAMEENGFTKENILTLIDKKVVV